MGDSRARARWSARLGWLALAAALSTVLAVAPIGYLGGGQDDWHYLDAARSWRENGPCVPRDHWQARWPLVIPLALLTNVLGESRLTVSLWPLAASIACVILIAMIGNRLFKSPVGFIAGLLVIVNPAFSGQLLTPSVEALELACILAGALAILKWQDSPGLLWPLLSGLFLSLAVQVRETALIAATAAAIWVLASRRTRSARELAAAAAAFALPFIVEFAVFAIWTGDPLWRRNLSIRHTQIYSSELLGPIDRDHLPFFNPAYIAHWKMEPGIRVHWLVDGILNLVVNPKGGIALLFVPILLLFGRELIPAGDRRLALRLWGAGIAIALLLIFVLAIDPKPRMMLVPIVAAIFALALLTWRLAAIRPVIAVIIWVVAALTGLAILSMYPRTDIVERPAESWIAAHPNQIETDENTRRLLALVKPAASLAKLSSDSPFVLLQTPVGCREWIDRSGLPRGTMILVDALPMSRIDRLAPGRTGMLCLLRYGRPVPGQAVIAAMDRTVTSAPEMQKTPFSIFRKKRLPVTN